MLRHTRVPFQFFRQFRMLKPPELKAASVHVLTALGVVCALFAMQCMLARAHEQAFGWLGLALVIDGIDGYFARRYDVKRVLPRMSGETLDLCVDYVTYVFVPALMLMTGGYLSGAWGMALASLICVTSLFHFSDTASKTADHHFVGFPAIWNIVAFYVFALKPPTWLTSVLVVACAALTFVPWRWVHPMRVTEFRVLTLVLTVAWAAAAITAVVSGFPASPVTSAILGGVGLYGVGLSLYFSWNRLPT